MHKQYMHFILHNLQCHSYFYNGHVIFTTVMDVHCKKKTFTRARKRNCARFAQKCVRKHERTALPCARSNSIARDVRGKRLMYTIIRPLARTMNV